MIKSLQVKLALFFKAVKVNPKHYIYCLEKITRLWIMANCNSFSYFYYYCYSKIYFWFVTIVVKFFSIANYCQKALKKLNNIIIDWFTIRNWLYIIMDFWQFDTTIDWKIIRKNINKLLVISIANDILVSLEIYIFYLRYLENEFLRFVELLNSITK